MNVARKPIEKPRYVRPVPIRHMTIGLAAIIVIFGAIRWYYAVSFQAQLMAQEIIFGMLLFGAWRRYRWLEHKHDLGLDLQPHREACFWKWRFLFLALAILVATGIAEVVVFAIYPSYALIPFGACQVIFYILAAIGIALAWSEPYDMITSRPPC